MGQGFCRLQSTGCPPAAPLSLGPRLPEPLPVPCRPPTATSLSPSVPVATWGQKPAAGQCVGRRRQPGCRREERLPVPPSSRGPVAREHPHASHRGAGDGQQPRGWAVVPGGTRWGASQRCLVAEFSFWALLAPEVTGALEKGVEVRWVSFRTSALGWVLRKCGVELGALLPARAPRTHPVAPHKGQGVSGAPAGPGQGIQVLSGPLALSTACQSLGYVRGPPAPGPSEG